MDRSFEHVRSFNRAVTLRTGALDDSYLGRGRPLGQARLLFEIGPAGSDLRALRERLGLDSGYLSRLLKSLQRQGLLAVSDDADDRRRRHVALTAKGRSEWAAYDALSDDLARSLLDSLNAAQCERLLAAMAEVERLMTAASISIEVEKPDSDAARYCLDAYFRELAERFEAGFDPAKGGARDDASMAPPEGCFMVVRLHGRPIGCGALKRLDSETGEIKRMWVAPDARGLGVAKRMLEALEARALQVGMTRIRLDTNRALTQAQEMYRRAGYREIAPYNDNPYAHFWFEKEVGDEKTNAKATQSTQARAMSV
jgi:DNA-binding MarR family transcriptional regulator/predicted GNAT family N-acyltransferase